MNVSLVAALPAALLLAAFECRLVAADAVPGENPSVTKALPPASTKQGVTFEKDIKPIFERACIECHGDEKHEGELRLNSLSEIQYGGEEGSILEPGDSAKSSVVLAVARVNKKTAMPPERKPGKDIGPDGKKLPPIKKLTAEEIGLIRAWIDQGAN